MSRRVTSPGSRAASARELLARAQPTLPPAGRARADEVSLYAKDPVVTRAMAIALMRQAQELLDAVGEAGSRQHLQRAIELLLPRPATTDGVAEAWARQAKKGRAEGSAPSLDGR